MKNMFLLLSLSAALLGCRQQAMKTDGEVRPAAADNAKAVENVAEKDVEMHGSCIVIDVLSDKDLWYRPSEYEVSTKLGRELVDQYNACHALNSIFYDFDLQMRFEDWHDYAKKAVSEIDLSIIKDNETRANVEAYRKEMLWLMDMDANKVDQTKYNPWKSRSELFGYLSKRYHVTNYADVAENEYWMVYNSNSKVKDWDSIRKKRCGASLADEMLRRYRKETDFDVRCIYAIEYAHACYAGKIIDDSDMKIMAVPILYDLVNEKTYSIYLYEVWRKWRTLEQMSHGMSRDSAILNDKYDEMRLICAKTTLQHILKNPDDIYAINNFLVLAARWDIFREGEFEYGNQNAIEEYMMFTEYYDSKKEKE